MAPRDIWPVLPQEGWYPTLQTVHMWTQIVGKVRLAQEPYENHWWQVPLYVTAHGLTTSPITYAGNAFQIDFDFVRHELVIECDSGARRSFPLGGSVAHFYREFMRSLSELGLRIAIWPVPVEVADPIPFARDEQHATYDRAHAELFFRVLWNAHRVLHEFRGQFLGKASPVHFFWGGFDLACTRFSGRPAPDHPPVPFVPNAVVREAYSHEVSSAGFWPGAPGISGPVFYSYAYPEPQGYRAYPVRPEAAFFHEQLGEYVLPYEAVQRAADPDALLLEFLNTSYEAAANLANWNRPALEHDSAFAPRLEQSPPSP